jgi:hypothetical protein
VPGVPARGSDLSDYLLFTTPDFFERGNCLPKLDDDRIGGPWLSTQVVVHRRRSQDSGVTILLVEQNVRLALALSDYAYVLARGGRSRKDHPSFPCAFRKSYPDVIVVQPRQDWDGDNDTGPLDCPT